MHACVCVIVYVTAQTLFALNRLGPCASHALGATGLSLARRHVCSARPYAVCRSGVPALTSLPLSLPLGLLPCLLPCLPACLPACLTVAGSRPAAAQVAVWLLFLHTHCLAEYVWVDQMCVPQVRGAAWGGGHREGGGGKTGRGAEGRQGGGRGKHREGGGGEDRECVCVEEHREGGRGRLGGGRGGRKAGRRAGAAGAACWGWGRGEGSVRSGKPGGSWAMALSMWL